MLHRTEALILASFPFSEADLIITCITLDYGIVRAFARSPRKIRSRFGSSLEPLTYAKISFWGKEESPLPRLTQSDIIRSFQPIRERMDSFFRVMEIAELTLSLLPERAAHRDVFLLLLDILSSLESNPDQGTVLNCLYYKVRLLDLLGYGPRLDGCARCSRKGYTFYISHGSILCGECTDGTDANLRLSAGVIGLYETLRKWQVNKLNRIKLNALLTGELSKMLDAHIGYIITKPLKTKALLG